MSSLAICQALLPLVVWVACAACGAPAAEARFFLRDGDRVVFLGDSITNAGGFVQDVDLTLRTRFPEQRFTLLNLGLPSEGVTGLTERDHPFPRPDVHERLERALAKTRPTVVVACYGMNDGIYHPFSEERFAVYQAGMRRLVERVRASGARLVLLTPPPFDPVPVGEKARAAGAADFSYKAPFAGYDAVLDRYSDWLKTLRGPGVTVVDIRTPVLDFLATSRRQDAKFALSADGVHLNAAGHRLIAAALLRAWGLPPLAERAELDLRAGKIRAGRVRDLALKEGGARFTWEVSMPLPPEPGLAKVGEPPGQDAHLLVVRGAPGQRYTLFEGDRPLGEVSRDELARGVALEHFPDCTLNRRAADLLALVRQRERLLTPAWVGDVGHKRPGTPAGLPLPEAERQAAALEERIGTSAGPVVLALRAEPAGKPE